MSAEYGKDIMRTLLKQVSELRRMVWAEGQGCEFTEESWVEMDAELDVTISKATAWAKEKP